MFDDLNSKPIAILHCTSLLHFVDFLYLRLRRTLCLLRIQIRSEQRNVNENPRGLRTHCMFLHYHLLSKSRKHHNINRKNISICNNRKHFQSNPNQTTIQLPMLLVRFFTKGSYLHRTELSKVEGPTENTLCLIRWITAERP
jgi:hypothetical protein